MRQFWRVWAKALGEKIGDSNEADRIALVRTVIIAQAVICNLFIIANIIKNW
jgi:hypothetical protein|tara:strand:- start:151 stop:306 length:156 start_codon:yes stop_codon:yes gene_type:complete